MKTFTINAQTYKFTNLFFSPKYIKMNLPVNEKVLFSLFNFEIAQYNVLKHPWRRRRRKDENM